MPLILSPKHTGKSHEERQLHSQDYEDVNDPSHKRETPTNMEYDTCHAMMVARLIDDIQKNMNMQGASFVQQYILQKGVKVFGDPGKQAAIREIDQLYQRNCFTPIRPSEMSVNERKKAMEALMFLTEKRDGTIKGRMVYNGKPTREWLGKEDSASPTAALESIFMTAAIDGHERRDVMTADIPNAFIQADMPKSKQQHGERVMMKITGILVDMLVSLNPELFQPYVTTEKKGKKVMYVLVLKAIYGMLEASLLWYRKFRTDLEGQGFVFNPYDPCVANRIVNKKQQTIRFHVDDVMSSHCDKKVNDDFANWLQETYGGYKSVSVHRGNKHDYLGMMFKYEEDGTVNIDMRDYVNDLIDDFPRKLNAGEHALTPAADALFDTSKDTNLLERGRAELFHTGVAKGLYLAKRAQPDIHLAIAFLATRVRRPTEGDWKKFERVIKYLNGTKDMRLKLRADHLQCVKWYVDASFAVHNDFRSHTGGMMTIGSGAIATVSRKQKLNTRSSTEAELVGADDCATQLLWTRQFLKSQGHDIKDCVLYQDNRSAILLESNGRKSAGKRSRALNVRYFFLSDQVKKGNLRIEYCPTDEMIGDFFTKPIQGRKFVEFRRAILGE